MQTVSDGARGLYDVNRWIVFERSARLGSFEGGEAVASELRGVDAFAVGQVRGELAESFTELTGRAEGIATLIVIQRNGAAWPETGVYERFREWKGANRTVCVTVRC